MIKLTPLLFLSFNTLAASTLNCIVVNEGYLKQAELFALPETQLTYNTNTDEPLFNDSKIKIVASSQAVINTGERKWISAFSIEVSENGQSFKSISNNRENTKQIAETKFELKRNAKTLLISCDLNG